eukprot:c15633_g1_i1.p1 GENE.c15633_g1_i1~~c15633_g1_i1.p1  ORF type:complete len:544 (+),score=153.22 c15633_g1_i1:47-1633(+)
MADEEKKISKKELNKLKKKEAKKGATEDAPAQATPSEDSAPVAAPVGDETTLQYGIYPMFQSQRHGTREFATIRDLDASWEGKTVWVRARVFTTRGKGSSCFILLRRGLASIQATLFKSESVSKEFVKFASGVSKESVIDVEAVVVKVAEKVLSASQQDVELAVNKLFVVSAAATCPVQVEDCMRAEPVLDEPDDLERPKVALKTRLDNRFLDLRAPANLSIFRIQAAVGNLFREFLVNKGFVEIHTPKILGTSSEGGADVFKVKYFEGSAFLAQSPQLYKQMAVVSDLERVFEIGAVYRAEKSNTPRHLTEFMGLDLEMIINEHYYEVLAVMNEMFKYIFVGLETRCATELATVRGVYPSEPVRFPDEMLVISFPEAIRMLREAGEEAQDFEDLNTPQEKLLGRLVSERFGADFYAIDRYPVGARPFYTMPAHDDKRYTNSYDVFLRGQEIASGAQRVHDAELLAEISKSKGVDLTPIQSYVDSFKYGAFPHGGCGIGLERVVMLYLGLHDIRKASMFPRDPARTTP